MCTRCLVVLDAVVHCVLFLVFLDWFVVMFRTLVFVIWAVSLLCLNCRFVTHMLVLVIALI